MEPLPAGVCQQQLHDGHRTGGQQVHRAAGGRVAVYLDLSHRRDPGGHLARQLPGGAPRGPVRVSDAAGDRVLSGVADHLCAALVGWRSARLSAAL